MMGRETEEAPGEVVPLLVVDGAGDVPRVVDREAAGLRPAAGESAEIPFSAAAAALRTIPGPKSTR